MTTKTRKPIRKPTGAAPTVVVYTRVSTKEQTENMSLDSQERECRRYCEREGFIVDRIFREEGESAKTLERPRLRELLDYCRRNKATIDHLVVYKIDRLSRRQHDHIIVRGLLKSYGVTLRSTSESITDDSTGRFTESILAAVAELDNDIRTERTVVGMKAVIEDGRWPFTAPLGYRRATNEFGRRTIEPDGKTAGFIREMFEVFATGQHSKAEVLRRVTAMGLRTTRKGKPLTPQTLASTLRNPLYAGMISVPSWELDCVPGTFAPIVTKATFYKVQALLQGRAPKVTPHERNNPDFPLRVFASCGACGTPMTGSWSKGRSSKYAYYRCRKRGCLAVKVGKAQFEAEFCALLQRLRPRKAYMRLFREIVLDVWKEHCASAHTAVAVLQKRIERLQGNRDKLVDAHVYRRVISEERYRAEADRLAQELALARMELHEAQVEEIDVEGVLAFAEVVLLNTRRLWIEGTLDQRQRLQKVLFPAGVTYSPESGFGTTETSLFFSWLAEVSCQKESGASPTGFEPVLPA